MVCKYAKKMLSVFLSLIILTGCMTIIVQAEDSLADITVTERNNKAVTGYPINRSIPFKKGELPGNTELCVMDGGLVLPSDTEVLESYDDGSVKWLLVSFTVDLQCAVNFYCRAK